MLHDVESDYTCCHEACSSELSDPCVALPGINKHSMWTRLQ